jgi:hypothetical protein
MTRLFNFMRLRKTFTDRTAARLAEQDPLGDKVVLVAMLVLFAWLGLDSINGYLNQRDQRTASHAVRHSAADIERLERVVVACLNGGAINVGGMAYECRAGSLGVKL